MLLQLLLGCVALGGMQAIKPINNKINQTYVSVYFQLDTNNFLEGTDIYTTDKISIIYQDSQSTNYKDINYNYEQEIVDFALQGLDYVKITYVAFIDEDTQNETDYENLTNTNLTKGYWNIYNLHNGYTCALEELSQLTPLREDIQMYSLLGKTTEDNTLLNGWYSFDNKYTNTYTETRAIRFYNNARTDNNSTVSFITSTGNQQLQSIIINQTNGSQYYLNGVFKDVVGIATISLNITYNVMYLNNVRTNESMWENYNVYRVNYPEELDNRIINKRIYINDFNPLGIYNGKYGEGNWGNYTSSVNNLTTEIIFNGVAVYNQTTITQLKSEYATRVYTLENYQYDMVTPEGGPTLQENWLRTYGNYNNVNYDYKFAYPVYTSKDVDDVEVRYLEGKVNLYTNEFLVLMSNDFSINEFMVSFNNSYYYSNGGEGNIFTLLRNGFMSWTVLFDFKIGPVSVGTLLFAPLVVGFIVWLIHLVKRG